MADGHPASRPSSWLRPLPLAALFTPVIAAPSGRGLVPVLLIIGMWAFLELFRSRRDALNSIVGTLLFFWAVITGIFVVLSSTWARVPAQSIEVGLSFSGLALFGLVLLQQAKIQTEQERESTKSCLIAGITIALALLLIGTIYGLSQERPLWGKEHQHPLSTLSHAQTVIAVLIVPAVALLWERGLRSRAFGVGLALLLAGTFFYLEHSASVFAVLGGLVAYLFVRTTGNIGRIAVVALSVLALVAMPFLLSFAIPEQAALDAMTTDKGPWPSDIHRLHMWRFVTDAISAGNFWIGFGADASRGFPGAAEKIMWGIELMPLHPHNGALQVWLELGAIGIVIAAAIPVMIARSLNSNGSQGTAIAAALLVAYMSPWLLSYGVWQSWWIALAWLAVCIGRGIIPDDTPTDS